MAISESLLPEFDQEMAGVRKTLERVPEDKFDRTCAEARAAIAGASDAELMKPWTLLSNDTKLFSLPKVAVLRSIVLNHLIHHRAPLGVYLRINDVAVPSLYGPSADETWPGF